MDMRARFFVSTVTSVVLGFLLFLLVLAISNANSQKLDITENRRFTLAEQSKAAVLGLKEPVKVYAAINEAQDHSKRQAEDLLTLYRKVDPSRFQFELFDPVRRPSLAKTFQIKQYGPAIVEVGAAAPAAANETAAPRRERINNLTEEELTNALLKLSRAEEIKVYSLTGHGERSLDAKETDGLSFFRSDMAKEGFVLSELNLARESQIPKDCRVLLMAGPTSSLLAGEEILVKEYLAKHGRVLLMLDPETPQSYVELLKGYGIEAPPDVIIDEASQLIKAEPIYALSLSYDPNHPITKGFRQNVVFRLARPVDMAKTPPAGATMASLAQTAPTAYLVPASDVVGKEQLRLDPNQAEPKEVSLAVAGAYAEPEATPAATPAADSKQPKSETRLVVVGDADFVSNHLFRQLGNRDFALNMVNWLAETENQISIRPRDAKSSTLRMSQSELASLLLIYVFLIPAAVEALGLFTVFRRRR